jgi:predicted dehydrogenase
VGVLRLIQVGVGLMGESWMRTVLAAPDVARYVALVETNAEMAAAKAAKYGVDPGLVARSLAATLAETEADGVLIVTPPELHRDMSIAALEAGLPVLCEKPLADSPEAARDVVAAAERTGRLHMVAQNLRYRAPIQTLKRELAAQPLGPVGGVAIEYYRRPHLGGFREEMHQPLITDMSIHHFDAMRFLLESNPVSVVGRSWNPPWSWFKGDASTGLVFEFDRGLFVSYAASWCSNGPETTASGNWRFECERGSVVLVDDAVVVQPYEEPPRPVPVPDAEPGHERLALLRQFAEAVAGGASPPTRCQDNIRSIGMVFDAIRACDTRALVRCEPLEAPVGPRP